MRSRSWPVKLTALPLALIPRERALRAPLIWAALTNALPRSYFIYIIFNKASMSRFNHLIKLISKSSKDSFLYHLLIAHVSKFQKFLPNYINLRRWTPLTHMHHVCVSEKRLAPRNVRSSYLLQLLGTLWKIVEGRDIHIRIRISHKERHFKITFIDTSR